MLVVMPVTDSLLKHKHNIFVDREDTKIKILKTKEYLSTKIKPIKTSTLRVHELA